VLVLCENGSTSSLIFHSVCLTNSVSFSGLIMEGRVASTSLEIRSFLQLECDSASWQNYSGIPLCKTMKKIGVSLAVEAKNNTVEVANFTVLLSDGDACAVLTLPYTTLSRTGVNYFWGELS
jgi:hypothetical protein